MIIQISEGIRKKLRQPNLKANTQKHVIFSDYFTLKHFFSSLKIFLIAHSLFKISDE